MADISVFFTRSCFTPVKSYLLERRWFAAIRKISSLLKNHKHNNREFSRNYLRLINVIADK
jgi:hypothetical protein